MQTAISVLFTEYSTLWHQFLDDNTAASAPEASRMTEIEEAIEDIKPTCDEDVRMKAAVEYAAKHCSLDATCLLAA